MKALFTYWQEADGRFRESTGTDLPASIRELGADLSGGSGLSDPQYIFCLRTDATREQVYFLSGHS